MGFAGIIKKEKSHTVTQDNISFGERVITVLEQQRRSKAWLAEKIGISKQAINYLLNHSATPKYVNEIAAVLNISPEWLVLGKGSHQIISESDAGIIQIPIITSQDLLSPLKNNRQYPHNEFTHITQSNSSKMCFATILDNSSMEPVFAQGTLLIFNPDLKAKNGDYVIFSYEQEIYFRQYFVDGNAAYLKAIDTMYRTFDKKNITILGVLIESRKHFK